MTTIFIFEVSRTTSKELNRVNKIVGISQKQKFHWKLNHKEIVKVAIWKMEKNQVEIGNGRISQTKSKKKLSENMFWK